MVSALLCAGLLASGADLGTSDQNLAFSTSTLSGRLRYTMPITLICSAKVRPYARLDETVRDSSTASVISTAEKCIPKLRT